VRERLVVATCIVVLLILTGYRVVSTRSVDYFVAGEGASAIGDNFASQPTEGNFYKILGGAEVGSSLKPGATVKLGELRRADGTSISFILAEGKFSDSTIEPVAAWKSLLVAPTILVSSADEELRNDGGISKSIGRGCH